MPQSSIALPAIDLSRFFMVCNSLEVPIPGTRAATANEAWERFQHQARPPVNAAMDDGYQVLEFSRLLCADPRPLDLELTGVESLVVTAL